jgi:hypothetical protein
LRKSKFALVTAALVGTLAAGTTTALAAQTPEPTAATSIVATFRVGSSGTFKVRFTDAADIAAANDVLAGKAKMHPIGEIVWDVTDVNTGHSWHLKSAHLTEMSTEVCDGQLDDVIKGRWNVEHFCPWNAELISVR